jgi:hypothetical protein
MALFPLPERKPAKINPLIYVIIAFILSRLLFFYVGIRFDASPLEGFWQFIDPDLLKHNLLQSVYYLHSQPPLFNLFLGSVLKLFPHHEALIFNLSYLLLGLILSVSIFSIMTRLGISGKLSTILTILFIISPACILYENWLFYTYPTTTFLCLSALLLHRFLSSTTIRDGVLFFGSLALVALTRSLFHILWFIWFGSILLFYQSYNWKKVVLAGCVPLLVLSLWYSKNLYHFGDFTASTWFGMNFSKITTFRIPNKERHLLVHQAKLSKLALIPPFRPIKVYKDIGCLPTIQKTNIPVLDQEIKSTGYPNFNNIAYIDISRQYLKDALSALKLQPKAYLQRGLGASFSFYFFPPTCYSFLENNRRHIQSMEKLYNAAFYGKLLNQTNYTVKELKKDGIIKYYTKKLLNRGVLTVLGLPVLIIYGLWLITKALSQKPIDLPFTLTLLFIYLNVVYVTIVGNCFEVTENNRFRFMIDPLFLIILGVFLNRGFKSFKSTKEYA